MECGPTIKKLLLSEKLSDYFVGMLGLTGIYYDGHTALDITSAMGDNAEMKAAYQATTAEHQDVVMEVMTAIGSMMAYLQTTSSYLCLFEHPVRVEQGRIADFPEKIYVCMRQEGQDYAGYDWDEAPVMYREEPPLAA